MQTIQTIYTNGKIRAKSWNGWAAVEFDAALSSEANHRAAADKLVLKLNTSRMDRPLNWGIVASAPSVPAIRQGQDQAGWTFIIGYVPEYAPLHMSITVRFMPGTNSGPAYMKVHSWINPRGKRVNYTPRICGSEIQGNARYAAEQELDRINSTVRESGDLIGYKLGDYVQLHDGDRLFTLVSGDAE